jgi:outer membrane biosynthesis protein TonB
MEHSSDKTPTENNAQGRRSLSWGVSLWVVLAVGVAIGYLFSQARITPGAPVQIVVTATPNPTEQPVAQTNQQPAQTQADQQSAQTQVDQQPTQTQADKQPTQPPTQSNPPATDATTDSTGALPPTPTIMEFVLSNSRHFQGNADAPVTMIEFSDFKLMPTRAILKPSPLATYRSETIC